jgi:sec-independent protein translocase protein TatC
MVVGALVIAAVLTPPDPITQMLMAGPIVILYEVGVFLTRLAARREASEQALS